MTGGTLAPTGLAGKDLVCAMVNATGFPSRSPMSMLQPSRSGRLPRPHALRAPVLPHRHGAPALGDVDPGRFLCPAGTATPFQAEAGQKPMRPGSPSTPPLAASPSFDETTLFDGHSVFMAGTGQEIEPERAFKCFYDLPEFGD